ncbi:MAG: hypothetical protein NC906_09170 [Candidatus Omnitrophica bacterium]|nr:hypothetical protein [Candidatus Omnitrophota bacterium]MCM8817811.1 hypothetical protein [Candidatus Omnitrophota bacterium]
MKKILMVGVFLLVAGGLILAAEQQIEKNKIEKRGAEQGLRRGPGEMGLGLYERLNLTEEQKAKIREIQKSRREQLSALQQDTTLSQEQKREKMRQIMESTQKQMDEVLTPEQRQQMEKLREEMRERMKQHWKKRNQGEEKPSTEAK